jgi:hypothetical protein
LVSSTKLAAQFLQRIAVAAGHRVDGFAAAVCDLPEREALGRLEVHHLSLLRRQATQGGFECQSLFRAGAVLGGLEQVLLAAARMPVVTALSQTRVAGVPNCLSQIRGRVLDRPPPIPGDGQEDILNGVFGQSGVSEDNSA